MFRPDPAEIARLQKRIEKSVVGDQLRDNHFYAGLYSRTDGIFADVRRPAEWIKDGKGWIRVRHRLRRREWIEKFFPIRTMTGEIKLLTLNPAQRMLEAQILRMERAGVPVRIIILKARQMGFCLSPDTRVLTADMRWVRIAELHVGDEIVGVDESIPGGSGASRKMRRAVVEAKREIHHKAVRIVTDHGTVVATPEHRFLTRKRGGVENIWREVSTFKVGDKIRKCAQPWGDSSFDDGWMGGIIDGEGHLRSRNYPYSGASLAIAQLPGAVMDRITDYFRSRGYTFHIGKQGSGPGFQPKSGRVKVQVQQAVIHRIDEIMRMIGQCRPTKHVNSTWWEGKNLPGKRIGNGWATVLSIEPLEAQPMVDIQTSTKTFIAEGLVSHNSTYVQGLMFERVLRGTHIRGLIVADNKDRSETLLAIAQIARTKMVKDRNANSVWNFRLTSKARDTFRFDEPMVGEVEVTTAEAPSAGIGGTRNILHLSESPRWKRPDQTYSDCLSSLPTIPWSYGFDEATAYGARGRFHADFWKSWNERDVPLFDRENTWSATFFAWWQHPEYFWTQSYGAGRPLPEHMIASIQSSLTVEEEWCLKQEYLRRWRPEDEWDRVRCHNNYDLVIEGQGPTAKIVGTKRVRKDTWVWRRKGVGLRKVSIDQLAWRRTRIADKHFGGDIDMFNQDYPSRPRLAFLSSGRPVFNQNLLTRMQDHAKLHPPLFRGTLRRKLEHTT